MHDTEMVRSANLGSKLQTTKTELVADFLVFFFQSLLAEMRERRGGRGGRGGGGRVVAQG